MVRGERRGVGVGNDDELEAWQITRDTGYVTFFSRTRNKLWTKGETSGNRLKVREVLVDCDEDTVLLKVQREGDVTKVVLRPGVRRERVVGQQNRQWLAGVHQRTSTPSGAR